MMFIYFHIWPLFIHFVLFIRPLALSIQFSHFLKILSLSLVESPRAQGTLISNFNRVSWAYYNGAVFIQLFFFRYLTIIFTSLFMPQPSPLIYVNPDLFWIATGWILCKMKYSLNIYIYMLNGGKNGETKIDSENFFCWFLFYF